MSRIPQPKAASERRDTELMLAIVNLEYQAMRGYIRRWRKSDLISYGAVKKQPQGKMKNGRERQSSKTQYICSLKPRSADKKQPRRL